MLSLYYFLKNEANFEASIAMMVNEKMGRQDYLYG